MALGVQVTGRDDAQNKVLLRRSKTASGVLDLQQRGITVSSHSIQPF